MGIYASIDVGATNIRIGVTRVLTGIEHLQKFNTPQSAQSGVSLIIDTIRKLSAGEKVDYVVIGFPGTVDKINGVLMSAANLSSWNGFEAKIVAKALETTVFVENDTALGGLGEANFGAGKGKKIVAYLAVGTGVGGARVINGELDEASEGFEPGQQILELNGPADASGQKGSFEVYVSGANFEKIYGVDPDRCKDQKVWEHYAIRFGQGIVNLISFWSPEIVILGGGMTRAAENYLFLAQKFVVANAPVLSPPPITIAALGDDVGLLGGLSYLDKIIK